MAIPAGWKAGRRRAERRTHDPLSLRLGRVSAKSAALTLECVECGALWLTKSAGARSSRMTSRPSSAPSAPLAMERAEFTGCRSPHRLLGPEARYGDLGARLSAGAGDG
jgi:hypothetical protein